MPKLLILALFVLFSSVMAAEQWKDWTLYPKTPKPDKNIRDTACSIILIRLFMQMTSHQGDSHIVPSST